MSNVLSVVRRSLLQAGVLPSSVIICGVSGGPDSMALLDALLSVSEEQGFSLRAAHFEHGLRGEDSREDAAFVENFCRARGIPCDIGAGSVAQRAKEKGCSLEAAAREMRYSFFEDCMRCHKGDFLALGHQAGDQAETLLMRLLRGGGVQALGGIAPMRRSGPGLPSDKPCVLIRPMLECSRRDILAYCDSRGISFRLDESNGRFDILRNRIRGELIPQMEKYNPQIESTLVHTADILRCESDYLDSAVDDILEKAYIFRYRGWDARKLMDAHPALRRRAVWRLGLSAGAQMDYEGVRLVCRCLQEGRGRTSLPGGQLAEVSCGCLLFLREKGKEPPFTCTLPGEGFGEEHLPWGGSLRWRYGKQLPADWRMLAPDTIFLDADQLAGRAVLRTRKTADRFHMLGGEERQKLKDVMMHWQIPRVRRDETLLLACENGIAAVVGHMPAHWARVTDRSSRFLRLDLIYNERSDDGMN